MKKNIKINKKEITVKDENTELTYEIKTIIAIFLLVTAYPVGVVLMFMWMKWPTWVKVLVCIPFLSIALIIFLVFGIMVTMVSRGKMDGTRFVDNRTKKEMIIIPSAVRSPKYRIIDY